MIIVMNEEAFDLSAVQLVAVRENEKLWGYFQEEAKYAADGMEPGPDDIRCAVLNAGTIWKDAEGLIHLADFDSRYFEYVWADDLLKWSKVK